MKKLQCVTTRLVRGPCRLQCEERLRHHNFFKQERRRLWGQMVLLPPPTLRRAKRAHHRNTARTKPSSKKNLRIFWVSSNLSLKNNGTKPRPINDPKSFLKHFLNPNLLYFFTLDLCTSCFIFTAARRGQPYQKKSNNIKNKYSGNSSTLRVHWT